MDAILFFYVLVWYSNGWSVRYDKAHRPTIWIQNHLKSELQKVRYSNVSSIIMVKRSVFRSPLSIKNVQLSMGIVRPVPKIYKVLCPIRLWLNNYVVCCCNLNNTRLCDEHLFDKLAQTQVVINWRDTVAPSVHQWRFRLPRFRRVIFGDVMSYLRGNSDPAAATICCMLLYSK